LLLRLINTFAIFISGMLGLGIAAFSYVEPGTEDDLVVDCPDTHNIGVELVAAGQQKPKSTKGIKSDRNNGKAPKKKPKTNPESSHKTDKGYTPGAIARREDIRNLTFQGLTQKH